MKIFRLGLISRIALLVVCIEVAAFGVLGWFYVDRFSSAIDDSLHRHLRLVGEMVATDELAISSISNKSIISDLVGAPCLDAMAIGGSGRVIVATNPSYLGRLANGIPGFDSKWIGASAPDEILPGRDTLTAVLHIRGTRGGAPMYTMMVTISTAEVNATKRSIALLGQFGALLFILLSSAGIVVIAQRLITSRVKTSLKMLKQVEEGALDARIQVTSDDELGQLQRGINSMTEQVGKLLNQHRRSEEESRAKSKLLDSIIDNIPDMIFLKRASDLSFTLLNKAGEKLLGYSRDEFLGRRNAELFPKKQADFFTANDLEVLDTLTMSDIPEVTVQAHDGEQYILHTKKLVLNDEQGKPEYLLGISEDITERKHMENLNEQYIDALRESEGKFKALFDFATDSIVILDMNGSILDINESGHERLGYAKDEMIGKRISQFDSPEFAHREPERLAEIHRTGNAMFESAHLRKDGSAMPVEVNSRLLELGGQQCVFSIVRDITDRKKNEQLIWQQANYDSLTGLPNRLLFHDRLGQELKKADRTSSSLALLFLDLDRFKEVNDTLGHARGDELLKETARRIGNCVRETDTVARLGGDEFTVILANYGGHIHLERIAQDIIQSVSQPYVLGAGSVAYVSTSIGITLYPNDAMEMEELIKHADQAMYSAKAQGRNRFNYFMPSMQLDAQEKLALTNDLRLALRAQQLEVYYQPIVDAVSGEINKAEALLRWKHPVRGMVAPSAFIPLAEESGLILEIGEWVFQEVITHIEHWNRQFGRSIQISVNMSPVQFEQEMDVSWINRLTGTKLAGSSINIEITEGLLIKDSSKVKRRLLEFRNHGIEVSIDDFGTGFSALSYLRQFDIDYLKIDRSFVSHMAEDESDKALTEAIIVMAHKLGIRTIAEGVETADQRDLLASFGCDFMQGYYFARPMALPDFEKMLNDRYSIADLGSATTDTL